MSVFLCVFVSQCDHLYLSLCVCLGGCVDYFAHTCKLLRTNIKLLIQTGNGDYLQGLYIFCNFKNKLVTFVVKFTVVADF